MTLSALGVGLTFGGVLSAARVVPSGASSLATASTGLDCNAAGNPSPSALYINQNEPTQNLTPGGSITGTLEWEVDNFTSADVGISVYFPSVYFTFPLSPSGNFSLIVEPQTVDITKSGWNDGVGTNRSQTVAAGLDFPTGGKTRASTQKVAIMADVPYGNLTLEFRWMWNLTQANGNTLKSPWSTPKSSWGGGEVLPSIFFPAQYIALLSAPPNDAQMTIGTNYTAELGGPVAGRYFFLEMEDGAGTVVTSQATTLPANATTGNVSITILNYDHYLTPGLYLVHIHDACGAILYNKLIDAVFAPTANITFYLDPGFCGPMTFNGTSFANGTTGTFVPSTTPYEFTVPKCAGYEFKNWTDTGGLHISSNDHLLVSYDGTFTIEMAKTSTVTFRETGLPSGLTWYVNISGQSPYSTEVVGTSGTSHVFTLSNGTYGYSVASNNKTWAASYSSPFVVSGSAVTVPVVFAILTFPVTLNETGLPPGTEWNLTIGTTVWSTNSSRISFNATNGTYPYRLGSADPRYFASPGAIIVNGSAVRQSVYFGAVTYNVSFVESGLPAGTNWSVRLNGLIDSSTEGTIAFAMTNGTFSFVVGTISGWSPDAAQGNVTVSGGPVTVPLTWTLVVYPLAFQETGLASGDPWWVNLTSGASTESTSSTIAFDVPNGTYEFSIGVLPGWWAAPASGSLNISGANASVPVAIAVVPPAVYSVTFNESGLPSGSPWGVSLAGAGRNSTEASIVFTGLTNGSYGFAISPVPGFFVAPESGSADVNGSDVAIAVAFTVVPASTYRVTFTESTLPVGTNWSVALAGLDESTTGGSIVFSGYANSSYGFSVGNVPGYVARPSSGTAAVDGSDAEYSIAFVPIPTPTYSVTFTETNLPAGAMWSVTLNGSTRSSFASTLMFPGLANGTFRFSIGAEPSFSASPVTGQVVVAGTNQSQAVVFSALPTAASPPAPWPWTDYALVGGVLAAAIVALAWLARRPPPRDRPTRGPVDEPPRE